jgi:tetratricopeptide (TPR) repeat protein
MQRWLSRDPIDEVGFQTLLNPAADDPFWLSDVSPERSSDIPEAHSIANLYVFVMNNPGLRSTAAAVWLLGLVLLVLNSQTLPAKPVSIAVLPPVNASGDTNMEHWRRTLDMLTKQDLRYVKVVRLVPDTSTKFACTQLALTTTNRLSAAQARQIGRLAQADRVLWGSYAQKQVPCWLGVQSVEVASGVVSPEITCQSTNWFEVVSAVVTGVLRTSGYAPTPAELARMRHPLTTSAAAFETISRMYQCADGGDEAVLRRALMLDPHSAFILQALAFALANEGKLDQALEASKTAVAAGPDYGVAHLGLGELCQDKGLTTLAKSQLLEAARLVPDNVTSRVLLSDLYGHEGEWTKAASILQEAESTAPFDAVVHARLGAIYGRMAKRDEAVRELQLAELYDNGSPLAPDRFVAETYAALHDIPQAIKIYEKHMTVLTNFVGPNPYIQEDTKESQERLATFKAMLTPHPVPGSAPQGFGTSSIEPALESLLTKGEVRSVQDPFACPPELRAWAKKIADGAREPFQVAQRLFSGILARTGGLTQTGGRTAPEVFKAWSRPEVRFTCEEYALLYIAAARSLGLDTYFVLVDRDFAGNPVSHACAGVILTNQQVLLVDPTYAWLGAPHREYKLLNDIQATAIYLSESHELDQQRIAVKLFPESARVHFDLAWLLSESHRIPEARRELDLGLKLDPNSWRACLAQGVVAWNAGSPALAEAHVRQALDLNPNCSAAHHVLAKVLDKRGDLAGAIEQFRRSISEDATPEEVSDAKEGIRRLQQGVATH